MSVISELSVGMLVLATQK